MRVTSVLDAHLKKRGPGYLVGDRATYADLMFVTWTCIFEERYLGGFDFSRWFEAYTAWMTELRERPAGKKVWAEWVAGKKAAS